MKKYVVLVLIMLFICGCTSSESSSKKNEVDSDSLIKDRIDEARKNDNQEDNVNKQNDEIKDTNNNNQEDNMNKQNDDIKDTNNNEKKKEEKQTNPNGDQNGGSSKEDNKTINSGQKNKFVSYNGNLKVSGNNLVNQYGEKIQLKGVSSHGMQWYGHLVTEDNLNILKNNWNSNVFRLAMYTVDGGYINNKSILNVVEQKMQMVINKDMYVIVDWHILNDGNPMTHINEAKEFFDYMSKKYANVPNVIFEICNEPNGGANWNNDIKPYADQIVSVIRKNSSSAVILIGTGTWSQDILDPVNNRVNDSNVMYDVHFYAGTHTDWLRNRVNEAYSKGLPIFISEWGTSDASGNGGVYLDESQRWVDFLNGKNISFVNWSLTDKNESSALLKNGCSTLTDNCLTSSGSFVKKVILK